MMHVKIASSDAELHRILDLRYKILRQPWQQSKESASDELEFVSVNAYIADANDQVIACGRLQENENKVGQIRYMAVDSEHQGKGLGKLILAALEEIAKQKGFQKIELQARENALDFYKANQYSIKEKSFLLWGIIQHYLMGKSL